MENEIIKLFLISLWLTFLGVRVMSSILHDKKNYGTKKEKIRTITGVLRRKTGLDWHHIHFGIIITIISLIIILFFGTRKFNIVFLGIGISLITDQVFPLFNCGNYFSKKMILLTITLNILISLLVFNFF
jgi:hypothetical protein